MGLFEKARYLSDGQLRAILEPGAAVPDEVLRRAIIELDAYRRELTQQLGTHAKEEAFISQQIAGRSAAVAMWRARRHLADERGRADLAEAALRRAEQEAAEGGALEKRSGALRGAIANLTVGLDKVDRTLRLVREKKRRLEAMRCGGAPAGATDDRDGLAGADSAVIAGFAGAPPAEDTVEAEFRRLEHEEVTRHVGRRAGSAPPPGGAPLGGGAPGSGVGEK